MQRSMRLLGVSIAAILVFAVAQFGCGTHAKPATAKAAPRAVVTPLYQQRLHEMHHIFEGKPDEALAQPARMQSTQDGVKTAFLFPSGLVSACAGSGCIGSACGASGCAASGCAGSGCGGSGCAGSACGGSGCAGSACAGSACAGSACGGSACVGSGCAGSACAGSGCIGSACGGSGCAGSSCGGSGCALSVCGGSACIGSACGLSGCAGSACAQSGCVGSACGQSGCVGSACKGCSSSGEQSGGGTMLAAYGTSNVIAPSCPFGSPGDIASVHVAGFNLARLERSIELSWITTGTTVESFKIYRTLESGTRELMTQGVASSGRLMHVALPTPKDSAASDLYTVAITDQLGWETRISSNGKTERQPLQFADARLPQ